MDESSAFVCDKHVLVKTRNTGFLMKINSSTRNNCDRNHYSSWGTNRRSKTKKQIKIVIIFQSNKDCDFFFLSQRYSYIHQKGDDYAQISILYDDDLIFFSLSFCSFQRISINVRFSKFLHVLLTFALLKMTYSNANKL